MEKTPIPTTKVDGFFERAGIEFQLSPAKHNRDLLLELKKVATLKEIRVLLSKIASK